MRSFSQISFSELRWISLEDSLSEGEDFEATTLVRHENWEIQLLAYWENSDDMIEVDFRISCESVLIAEAVIILYNYRSYFLAKTSIIKKSPDRFPGIGISLYKKILEYLEYLSALFNKTICHKIIMATRGSHFHKKNKDYGLCPKKWERIFFPVLEEYGYRPFQVGIWSKKIEINNTE